MCKKRNLSPLPLFLLLPSNSSSCSCCLLFSLDKEVVESSILSCKNFDYSSLSDTTQQVVLCRAHYYYVQITTSVKKKASFHHFTYLMEGSFFSGRGGSTNHSKLCQLLLEVASIPLQNSVQSRKQPFKKGFTFLAHH